MNIKTALLKIERELVRSTKRHIYAEEVCADVMKMIEKIREECE